MRNRILVRAWILVALAALISSCGGSGVMPNSIADRGILAKKPHPTPRPSRSPSATPSASPTASPTVSSTVSPTVSPTESPTISPTESPTIAPSESPSPPPTETPTPLPSETPTPVPTEPPPGPGVAYYHGRAIFASSDLYYRNISDAAIDPDSATIIGNLNNVPINIDNNFVNSSQVAGAINLATNATPVYPLTGSHNPPKAAGTSEPYEPGFFLDTSFCPACSDAHYYVLNLDSGIEWEDYQFRPPTSGTIYVSGGHVWDLNVPLASQYGPPEWTGGANAGDAPEIAGADISDRDAAGNPNAVIPINHAEHFYAAESATAAWGYVRPANSSTGVGCNRTGCSLTHLIFGDRLRLKQSALSKMACYGPIGGLCPQASALAQQWITYGIILDDTNSRTFSVRFFNSADGSSSWNLSDLSNLNVFTSNDFEVISRGALGRNHLSRRPHVLTGGARMQRAGVGLTSILALLATSCGGGSGQSVPSVAMQPGPPPPAGSVLYHGRAIFARSDLYYTNVSTAAVDPNSSTIIGNMRNVAMNLPNDFADASRVIGAINIATNATPTYPVTGIHNPPMANAMPEPYEPKFFSDSSFCPACTDVHYYVLNVDSGIEWENYEFRPPSSGEIFVGGGHVWDLNHPLASQYASPEFTGGANAADVPEIAGADISDRDAAGNANAVIPIDHAAHFYAAESSSAAWGYVRPANSSTGVGCAGSGCSTTHLLYGDRLRLKRSALSKLRCYAAAGGSCPQASALADQWIAYGLIFDDTDASTFAPRLFNSADGSSSWNMADLSNLDVFTASDFEVLSRSLSGGVICPAGHVC